MCWDSAGSRSSSRSTWDVSEHMTAFFIEMAESATTSRRPCGEHGAPSCCVKELTVLDAVETHGWGGWLGAAFPHITSLEFAHSQSLLLPFAYGPPFVPLLSGLAACRRLTNLDLGYIQPMEDSAGSTHLLRAWLPNLHALACCCEEGPLALVRGLSAQLRHLRVRGADNGNAVAAALAACTQLASVQLDTLHQAAMKVLVALPNVTNVSITGHTQLYTRPAAHWSVRTLSLGSLEQGQAAYLPLTGLQQLKIGSLQLQLLPSSIATGSAVRAACSLLAAVPQVQISGLGFDHVTRVSGQLVRVAPDQADHHLQAALAALQPLAGRLGPSLKLKLRWLGGRREDAEQGRATQLGPEVLRGLHAAGLDGSLTKLRIRASYDRCWAPSAGFWATLPDVLPQLQTLELRRVAPLDAAATSALGATCARLQHAGRSLELVFELPMRKADMRGVAEQLGVYAPHVRVCVR